MKGDFSRLPHNPADNISRVLFQQGKPLVEADLNEALMAILANQRKIIRRTREDANHHHGAFDAGFQLSRVKVGEGADPINPADDVYSFQLGTGDYRFEDLLFTNQSPAVATAYESLQGGKWAVHFAGQRFIPDGIKNESFVVALAATERPMLISEMAKRAPSIGNLRSSIPWIVDWAIVLEPTEGSTAAAVRADILARNEFSIADALGITVNCDKKLPREFSNRLWRVEIHKIDGDNVVLKIAIDNASRVFPANKPSNVRIQRFNGELPREGEFIEAESQYSWLKDPGSLHPITQLQEHRDGIISNGEAIANEVSSSETDQIRSWSNQSPTTFANLIASADGAKLKFSLPGSSEEYTFTVKVNASDANTAKDSSRRGDGWTFQSNQIATGSTPTLISGTRRPVYYAPLGTVEFTGENVTAVTDDRTQVTAGLGTTRSNLARSEKRESTTLSQSKPEQSAVASLPCQRLFHNLENVAIKRWLASTTLGEIASLSKDELRTRIESDCGRHGSNASV